MKKLLNGNLIEIDDDENLFIEKSIEETNNLNSNINDPIDRIRITDDVKLDLKKMYDKYPETKVILTILLGNYETDKILKG